MSILVGQRCDSAVLREIEWPAEYRLLDSMPDGVVILDGDGRIVFANRQLERMTAYTRLELIRRKIELLVPPRLRAIHEEHREPAARSMPEGRPMGTSQRHFPARRKDGTEFSADIALGWIATPKGRHAMAVIRDITQRVQLESAVEHMALHDPLTGLANRTLFLDRLSQAILDWRRDRRKVALVVLDVNAFRDVNDAYGHLVGDQVLCRIALRLGARLRAADTVARLGGDEFAWILPRVAGREAAEHMVQELLSTELRGFVVGPQSIEVGLSAGIAVCPDVGEDSDTLLRHAELELYSAKRRIP
jgi:diguanylate cyclase (GGDEF)-like protein/PAS domain S-box-containing protein